MSAPGPPAGPPKAQPPPLPATRPTFAPSISSSSPSSSTSPPATIVPDAALLQARYSSLERDHAQLQRRFQSREAELLSDNDSLSRRCTELEAELANVRAQVPQQQQVPSANAKRPPPLPPSSTPAIPIPSSSPPTLSVRFMHIIAYSV